MIGQPKNFAYYIILAIAFAVGGCTTQKGQIIRFQSTQAGGQNALLAIYNDLKQCMAQDPVTYKRFGLIPEFDTKYGKPRLLMVEKAQPQNRPALVIASSDDEASNGKSKFEAYGPLLSGRHKHKIIKHISHWKAGKFLCASPK